MQSRIDVFDEIVTWRHSPLSRALYNASHPAVIYCLTIDEKIALDEAHLIDVLRGVIVNRAEASPQVARLLLVI